jgi:hypothetical protein
MEGPALPSSKLKSMTEEEDFADVIEANAWSQECYNYQCQTLKREDNEYNMNDYGSGERGVT